jgi:hypothetical protein
MNAVRNFLLLLVVAGILLCPYRCNGVACAHAKGFQESAAGCHCQKCQHKSDDRTRPAEDPADGHCCVCVCDGALAKAAEDDLPCVVLLPSFDTLVLDCSLPAMHVFANTDLFTRPVFESGKFARIVLRSLVI